MSKLFGVVVLFVALFLTLPHEIVGQTVEELENRIEQRNADIRALEREIAEYQKQINYLGSQASSLSSTIKSLELTQKKLEADIKVTENKIAAKSLEIQELSLQIGKKERNIDDDRRIIAQSFVSMNEFGGQSLPEMLLGSESLSGAWHQLEGLSVVQRGLEEHISELRDIKARLETNKRATERAKTELISLNEQIKGQRKAVVATAAEKNSLLKETKQSEAQYQKILKQKTAQKEAFEKELYEYESQLRLAVDASKLPKVGSGVLRWPLDNVFVTQYFGNTAFSTANPQIYNGKGHTGIDLRASIGTPVKSALSGVVAGVGDTDAVPGCYSYGKWVMVTHANGLSTLYAHLSVIGVTKGETVSTGQPLGYSGNTGYSTGPHLHFGVYATQGVQIRTFDTSRNCRGALIPLADFKAYLNPLSYL